MRRLTLLVVAVLAVAAAGAAGWHFLRPHDPLDEARRLMAEGNLRAAQLVLRGLVQDQPERAEAHLRLGETQLTLGDPTAAEKELRAAAARGAEPRAVTPLLARAVVLQDRNEEVLRDYRPDGLEPSAAATVLVARAEAQLSLGQPDAAAASIAEAQRLAPKSVPVALAAARLASARHDTPGAEALADAALALDPRSLEALVLQAELRARRGDAAGAVHSYDVAVGEATAAGAAAGGALDTIRLARAGLLMSLDKDAAARADTDAVLKSQPRSPLANYLSAQLHGRAHDWKAADAALSAAGPVLDRMPRSDLMVASIKANVGQPEQAVEAAGRQVARDPGDLAAIKLLAALQMAQQRPERAAEALAAAASAGHADAETLGLLSQIYASTGKPQQALEAIRQASALAPTDPALLTRLASLQLRQGDPNGATRALQRALDLPALLRPIPVTPVSVTPDAAIPGKPPGTGTSVGPAAPSKAQTAAALAIVALQAGEIDHAVAALEQLRAAQGDPLALALLDGLVKLAQIDLPGARAAFEEARRLDPASLPARLNLARVLVRQGHAQEAAALLEEGLAGDPGNGGLLSALVDLRLAEHQPEPAVAAAEAAHAARPEDAGIVAGLAELYTRIGQPAKALALLDGVKAPPQPAPGLVTARVRADLALGQPAAAAASLRGLLDSAPDDAGVRRQLVELLAAAHEFDAAQAVLREGLGRHPGEPALLAESVALAAQQDGPAAAAARAAALADDPTNPPSVRRLHGDLLMQQRQYAAAAAAYQALLAGLATDSADAEPLTVAAAAAIAAGGEADRAAGLLHDRLAAQPNSPAAALALSGLDLAGRRVADAAVHLRTVLASQPNNPAALNNLAWVSQQLGDLTQARALAGRSYLLAPTPQAADTLGWVMFAAGKPGEAPAALALLHDAAAALPDNASIKYHLAAALARDGQKAAAKSLLQALLGGTGAAAAFDEKPAAQQLLHEVTAL